MIPTLQLASAAWRRITRPRPAVLVDEPAAVVVEPTPEPVVTVTAAPWPPARPGAIRCDHCGWPAWHRCAHYCRDAA